MSNSLSKEEIDVLMNAVSGGPIPGLAVAQHHIKQRSAPMNVKEYDFRHPVMFLQDQLRTLKMIHEAFARNFANSLATYLCATVHVRCISVNQFSYGDFARSLPDPCTLAKIRFRPSEGRVLMAISPEVGAGFVDRVMGGPGGFYDTNQPFTEIEQFVIDDVVAIALKELEPAWNRLIKVSFVVESVDFTTQFVHVASQEEPVVALVLEIEFGSSTGIVTFCYPFRALNPIIEKLNARQWVADDQKNLGASRNSMQTALNEVKMKLSARLGSATLTMKDIISLKAGDVFMLNKELDEPADLDVGGCPKFKGYFGTHNGKLAIRVSDRLK